MLLKNIHSKYIIQELFSFISHKKKLKLIQNNSFLIQKLEIPINEFKILFLQKKLKNYDFCYIEEYYEQFRKDFKSLIGNKEELKKLFLICLSKNKNFDLQLLDKYLALILENPNFKDKLNVKLEDLTIQKLSKEKIPTLLLIKEDKFTEKANKTFKDIFDIFSTGITMNKQQTAEFIGSLMDSEIHEGSNYVKNIFLNYDLDHDGLLSFDDFSLFFIDMIKEKSHIVWKYLYSLGYNNLLEKNESIDYEYIIYHLEEFEKNLLYTNLLKISNQKIFKLSLSLNIDEIFFQLLKNKQIFQNLKILDISLTNLNKLFETNIFCPNIEELYLNVFEGDLKYNIIELLSIFPKIKVFNIIYIENKFDIFDIMNSVKNTKIETLKIVIYNFDEKNKKINFKKTENVYLETIKNLEIDIGKGFNYINNFLFQVFNHIQFPFLEKYILHLNLNELSNQITVSKNSDFNIINQFVIDILNYKNLFSLKKYFNLINQLKLIKNLQINFRVFDFIYKNKRHEKYLFKFNINKEDKFKKYYTNYDLSIDEEEIIKYKKIDIKGINHKNYIENIIEKKDINICDIYFNINLKQYFIKSLNNIRTIYCEDEIPQNNLIILNKGNLKNLKHINLSLDDIDLSSNILSQIIKKSKNLKSLILKLSPNNFNQNVYILLDLIENLKKLKIFNIKQNIKNPEYSLNLEKIFDDFPKLKERKYCFEEFIIGDEGFILKKNRKNNILTIKCIFHINENLIGYPIQLIGNKENEIKEKSIIYLKNKKINVLQYSVNNKGNYLFNILFKTPLTKMNCMFFCCSSLTSLNFSNFNTESVTNMKKMFFNCTSLKHLNLSYFKTINVTDMSNMFYNCSSLSSLDISNFNTKNVIDMSEMFYNCSSLTSLDLSNFYTKNVTNMSYMFYECSLLNSLDLSNFNTKNVIYMNNMFSHCSKLISLNLPKFKSNKVINMSYMFCDCSSLTSLNLSNFKFGKNINYSWMFYNCSSLSYLNLSNLNSENMNNMVNIFKDFNNCKIITKNKIIEKN